MSIVADFFEGQDNKPITDDEIAASGAQEANEGLGEIQDHEEGSIAPPESQNIEDEGEELDSTNYEAPANPIAALEALDFSGLENGPEGSEEIEDNEEGERDSLERVVDGEGEPEVYTAEQVENLKAQWLEEMSSQNPQTNNDVFANEQIEKLNEIVKAGGEIDNKFWEYQNIDFDAADLTDSEVVREVLKAHLTDVEKYSDEDADFILDDKYPLLGKKPGEDAYEEDVVAHNRDSRKAKIEAVSKINDLKEYQQSLMLPKVDPNQQQATQAPEIDPKVLEAYSSRANASIDDYDGFDFDLGKDMTLTFKPDEEDMGYIRSVVSDLNKQDDFFKDRYVQDGKVNFDKFQTEMHILNNLDGILKEAFQQMGAMAREQMAKEDGISPSIRKGRPTNTGGQVKSMADQILGNAKY